jgi:hypothetical protein
MTQRELTLRELLGRRPGPDVAETIRMAQRLLDQIKSTRKVDGLQFLGVGITSPLSGKGGKS